VETDILEWVERLGGWGVVIWVVAYFMRENKADRESHEEEMTKLVNSFSNAINSFQEHGEEERKMHQKVLDELRALPDRIRAAS
jgi:hypothetical protein